MGGSAIGNIYRSSDTMEVLEVIMALVCTVFLTIFDD